MANKNQKLKTGDIVFYKDDAFKDPYVVLDINKNGNLSLSLRDYPDTEQDFYTNRNKVSPFEGSELKNAKKIIKGLLN